MSSEEVATRAPESDAAQDAVEASPFKGDSIAQEGPSMGVRGSRRKKWLHELIYKQEHCTTDRPTRMYQLHTKYSRLAQLTTYSLWRVAFWRWSP